MKNRMTIIFSLAVFALVLGFGGIHASAYGKSHVEVGEEIVSSSALSGGNYSADNLCDYNLTTAWVEGASGDGIGEYVEFEVAENQRIDDIVIATGYQKSDALFAKNSAPTRITISSGSYRETVDVKDEMGFQVIPITPVVSNGRVRVRIDAVRRGSKYTDTCISELHFLQEADYRGKYKNTTISFATIYGSADAYGIITARDKSGAVKWSKVISGYMTELTTLQAIGIKGNQFLYLQMGTIHALNPSNGREKWSNDEFGGASASFVFTSDNKLILCGYYGPDFFMCDADGRTIASIGSFDDRYYWPYEIRLNRDETIAEVTLDGGIPYPDSVRFIVDLRDFSYRMAK